MTADLDLIRRAANQMRGRALSARTGRLGFMSRWTTPTTMLTRITHRGDTIAESRSPKWLFAMEHWSHWDTEAALAVADLLTCHADGIERTWSQHATDAWPEPYRRALTVARAFLKEDA